MRTVFMGTAEFSVPSLISCAEQTELLAVVTQPDRPGNRGKPAPRPVADEAQARGIRVLQPERLRGPGVVEEITALNADALVVAAYGQILPAGLLEAHVFGGINVHASLLPRWRGAAPVNAAILAGDEYTGVSIMSMEAGLDTGPVYVMRRTAIGDTETAAELTQRLAAVGAEALGEVLSQLDEDGMSVTPQAQDGVTLAPRMHRGLADVEWDAISAGELDRHRRAMVPWPGTNVVLGGQRVRLLEGFASDHGLSDAAPGEVMGVAADAVTVQTRSGTYVVTHVQPPGSRPMPAAAYLRGRRG
jgi:methionyl-tRNA formyltransferase